jgi:hypothetical protein
MKMKVVSKLLIPGMQNTKESQLAANIISAEFKKCFGD